MHNPTENVVKYRDVYARRGNRRHGGQARKHVCRQSLQFVALKAKFPVGEERHTVRPIDTRSARAHACKRKEQQQVDGNRAECCVLSMFYLEGRVFCVVNLLFVEYFVFVENTGKHMYKDEHTLSPCRQMTTCMCNSQLFPHTSTHVVLLAKM